MQELPLDVQTAGEIYDILVDAANAPARQKENFVHSQTTSFINEWRFQGALGFGGKFWRGLGKRLDGTWGERWCVTAYVEDETPELSKVIEATNAALWALQND